MRIVVMEPPANLIGIYESADKIQTWFAQDNPTYKQILNTARRGAGCHGCQKKSVALSILKEIAETPFIEAVSEENLRALFGHAWASEIKQGPFTWQTRQANRAGSETKAPAGRIGSRPGCLNCVQKHLARASIKFEEADLGYPHAFWYGVAHLAEAAEEAMELSPKLALEIQAHVEVLSTGDKSKIPDIDALLNKALQG